MRRQLVAVASVAAALALACGSDQVVLTLEGGGDSRRGPEAIERHGCGACHEIPGVRSADGRVAPPLADFSERTYVAGRLANTPEHLVAWLLDPQAVDPATAMPDVGLTEEEARDIAAYLLSLGR